jgi:hypothetical protein
MDVHDLYMTDYADNDRTSDYMTCSHPYSPNMRITGSVDDSSPYRHDPSIMMFNTPSGSPGRASRILVDSNHQ